MKIKRQETKGKNGKVLVVGGSKDYVGAPYLAAMAAFKTGVDLVTVCAPEKVSWTLNSMSPDLITKKMLGEELDLSHVKEILSLCEKNDVLLIGNGLGEKKEFVNKIIRNCTIPMVIDADAIKVIDVSLIENSIITPHSKEFEILYNNSTRKKDFHENNEDNIKTIQKIMNNNVILLKGKHDIIFTRHRKHTNKTGTNTMTVEGTGDVLAGICAGLLSRSKKFFDSAKDSAYINGKTGEYCQKQYGVTYLASDMLNEVKKFLW